MAQAYKQPWLYAVAASSAIGRLQSREHWVSDTVAGGLLGYAIGSLTYQHQQAKSRAPRISLSEGAVTAQWGF